MSVTPLSNDPESIADYAASLGLDPTTFEISEVFSFDPELLQMLPPNIVAFILLFPCPSKDSPLAHRQVAAPSPDAPKPWFTKQTIENSCGTIALLHSIVNNKARFTITEDSWLSRFLPNCENLSPDEIGELLLEDDDLQEMAEDAAALDDTPVEEVVDLHFVAFVEFDGKLWELDGLREHPICHGPVSSLTEGASNVIQTEFIPNVEDPMRMSCVALSATQ